MKLNRLALYFLLISASALTGLHAQDASAAAGATEITMADRWEQGGWAMWPLLALSIGGVGLIVYNFMMVRRKVLAPQGSIDQLKALALNLDIDGINTYCENTVNPVTNIFAAGMERISPTDFDPAAIQLAMDDATAEELAGPFAMINFLNVVANIAPMVGMTGTVSGMVKAFGNIAASGGMADPAVMATNISEALITTMSGLVVAIPAMFFYFFFKNKYGKMVASLNRSIGDIYHTLIVTARNPEAAAYAQEGEVYEAE